MDFDITIHKIKCIDELSISLPTKKGLYAITGQNGSGKSTVVACASSLFFSFDVKQYFGKLDDDASICFEYGDYKCEWKKDAGKWKKTDKNVPIYGFFEGSLLFGNRFKDMNYEYINKIDYINQKLLLKADDFIRKNLGYILQGDEDYYTKLWLVSPKYENFKGNIFFYEKNGKRISQYHMSTGENLLVSILNALYRRNKSKDKSKGQKPYMMFLDEIELALHPSSLRRLIVFLEDMSKEYNYAIYFSTHSIELISRISPSNIFYLERHADNSIEVLNPCYPAYATKNLYLQEGYDKVIFVEDDLAKSIVDRILRDRKLMNNRLIHIQPSGGYMEVIKFADDVMRYNLFGRKASLSIILDGDVRIQARKFRKVNHIANGIPLHFLPIESLEKFLRKSLYLEVNHSLFRILDNYLFQNRGLSDIIAEYKRSSQKDKDNNGKYLYSLLEKELIERRVERAELIKLIVEHLAESKDSNYLKLVDEIEKDN